MNNDTMDWVKDIDWSCVDNEKMRFFFQEARTHNNALIADINSLNAKAFTLLAIGLPLFSFAVGLLASVWMHTQLVYALSCFSLLLCAALIVLFLAVYPQKLYRSEAQPEPFFKSNYYKASLQVIYSGGIAALDGYIKKNRRIMRYRAKLISAALIIFIASPVITFAVFALLN